MVQKCKHDKKAGILCVLFFLLRSKKSQIRKYTTPHCLFSEHLSSSVPVSAVHPGLTK